jgi:hypothetical protein
MNHRQTGVESVEAAKEGYLSMALTMPSIPSIYPLSWLSFVVVLTEGFNWKICCLDLLIWL